MELAWHGEAIAMRGYRSSRRGGASNVFSECFRGDFCVAKATYSS